MYMYTWRERHRDGLKHNKICFSLSNSSRQTSSLSAGSCLLHGDSVDNLSILWLPALLDILYHLHLLGRRGESVEEPI